MQQNLDACPDIFTPLQHQHRFCRERRKGRESSQKTRNDEKPPLRTEVVVPEKERCRHADNKTAAQIGNERSQWDMLMDIVQPHPQTPP